MIDLELMISSLDDAYYDALKDTFNMYFSADFPASIEQNRKRIDGTLLNLEDLRESYETIKKALQAVNMQQLQGKRGG